METGGNTTLSGGDVVSTASGNIASLSLVNGLVGVEVLENPMLTATSDGTTESISANDYRIAVTIAGQRTELSAGMSVPINLDVGVLSVNLTLSVGQLDDTSSGATGSGSMSFLNLTGSINGPLGGNLASVDLGLLPLSATATAPEGGVECGALDAPVITSPANGDTTSETPTITGTGTPGTTVTVSESGTEIGTASVGEDGTWSLTPATPLSPGEHTITATQNTDTGASPPSEPVTFTVQDTQPPEPPSIDTPDSGAITGGTPTISGTGEVGATVTVSEGGAEIGTAVVDGDGNWSLTPSTPLTEGPHTITATQTDAGNNTSQPSDPVSFTVDTTAPDPPEITSPENGSVTTDDTPQITGTGEIGATVDVTIDGQNVGQATVDEQGVWTLDLTAPLADGAHSVEATQTDWAGRTSQPATSDFVVDTTADAPVIDTPENGSVTNNNQPEITGTGEPGATVTVWEDGTAIGTATVDGNGAWRPTPDSPLGDGQHTITATQEDGQGNMSPESNSVIFTVDTMVEPPTIATPDADSLINDRTPEISGTGEPGATVQVSVDGQVIGEVVVGDDDTWSITPTEPLGEGEHLIEAVQTDAADNTSGPAESTVTVTSPTPAAPEITGPQEGSTVDRGTPTITGTGTPGNQVEAFVDGESVGTTTVGENGTWMLESSRSLSEGQHTVTARQQDSEGRVSPESEPVGFTVDTQAEVAAPEITSPESGSSTSDNTPTIEGTGTPGAEVTVYVDGEQVGTAQVGDDGRWSFTPDAPLDDGSHTITATQTVGGDTSPVSDGVVITVDTSPPSPPVVTDPEDGGEVDDRAPTAGGTGEPGATVEVVVDGESVGTATVGQDGSWALDLPRLGCGRHTMSVTQTTGAGLTSEPTELSFAVVCAGGGGDGGGDDGTGGGDGSGGGSGDGGGQHLITAPPAGQPHHQDTFAGGGKDLAQTGTPLALLAWLGLLAVASGSYLVWCGRGRGWE
ncbi:Ig-like domain (group 3) [Prauserella aidingensis]|uniref:Ig-like domain-containing protein n=1 Tax=Prauserella aidingensis TaxID=387890 RepID=UPI0027E352CE|nr:Ig-like domain-containing protein [Prauserella aidingensis]MCP2251829.1 Ig-like domain (group 3) [Prauserella aidingensis]